MNRWQSIRGAVLAMVAGTLMLGCPDGLPETSGGDLTDVRDDAASGVSDAHGAADSVPQVQDLGVTIPDAGRVVPDAGPTQPEVGRERPIASLALLQVTPSVGPTEGGTLVSILAKGARPGVSIRFGGAEASNVSLEGSQLIVCVTPPGLVGAVDVTIQNANGLSATLPGAFAYLAPAPLALDAVIPAEGPLVGGNTVVVKGAGFVDGMQVLFGSAVAPKATVESGSVILAVVPPGAVGVVPVIAQNPAGDQAVLTEGYAYVALPEKSKLALSSVTPATGVMTGGTPFVLTGDGFVAGATVRFGAQLATDLIVQGASVLTGRTPSHAAGTATVTITLPSGQEASLDAAFEFQQTAAPLAISGITPNSGPQIGGNLVGVHGQGFKPGAVVRLGANMAYGIQVITDTYITATAPAGVVGSTALSVTNPGGDSATLENAYQYTAVSQLSTLSVQPTSSPEEGGTLVVVSGTGFDADTVVLLGDTSPAVVEVASSKVLFFETPPHAAGLVDLVLTSGDGQVATLANAFTYQAAVVDTGAAPIISLVSPSTGPASGGSWVSIAGAHFVAGATVQFGQTAATTSLVTGTQILTIAPPGQGAVSVRVTNPDGQTVALQAGFTYTEGASEPTLGSVSPASGPSTGGTLVDLVGTAFMPGATVWFGTTAAAHVTWLDGQHLVVQSPPSTPETTSLTVVNPDGGVATLSDAFGYYAPGSTAMAAPTLFGAYPTAGSVAGGDLITLTGAGFQSGTTVHFGQVPVAIEAIKNSTTLTLLTPPMPAGAVDLTVTNPDGASATLAAGFLYFSPPPVIVAVSPSTGPVAGENLVTITGQFFSPEVSLRLDGKKASGVLWVSSTQITVLMPPHLPGAVDVEVENPTGLHGIAAGAYTYQVPVPPSAPALTAISPAAGPPAGGTQLVLTGQGFATGMSVAFDSVEAAAVTVHASTVAVATVPAGAAGSIADVTVTNPDGLSGTLEAAYSYDQANLLAALSVSAILPATGPTTGGTVLTVAGTGFAAGTTVHFGTAAASFVTVVSSTLLTVVTPALQPGLTDLVVKRPDGQQIVVFDAFLAAPTGAAPAITIDSATPAVGPIGGGTLIELTGSGFVDGITVSIGGVSAPELTILSATAALVRTPPAQVAGSVSVAVVGPNGGGAVLAGGFTYYEAAQEAAPVVLSVSPQQGTSLGGSELTVVGTGFSPGAWVFICNIKALVNTAQANSLSVTAPGGPIGPCTVEVVSPGGLSGQLPNAFKYVAPTPVLTDLVPSSGTTAGGVNVVIKGQGFVPGIQVSFGGKPATSVTVWDPLSMLAVAPPGDAGTVDVTITSPGGAEAIAPQAFTYVSNANPPAPPTIDWLFPIQGSSAGATPIEIHGAGFETGATVLLGGDVVNPVSVVNPNLISLVTAPHVEGPVTVTILNPSGLGATLINAFEYIPADIKPPQLLGVAPKQGPSAGGLPLTISGKGFAEGGKVQIGGAELVNATFVDDTLVTGILPAGTPGSADLSYVRPDGTFALLKGAFNYIAPPSIDAVSPAVGPVGGGTEISIVGANFQDGITILLDGSPAQLIELVSSSQVRVSTPPASAAGLVDVRVLNSDGQEAVLTEGFAYLETPTIDALDPSQGSVEGGTLVVLTGTNLHPGAQFLFGDAPAQQYGVGTPTRRVLIAPPHAAGLSQVNVLNPDGQAAQAPFKYLPADKLGALPMITAIAPSQGGEAGGSVVTIDGDAFTADSRVLFGAAEAAVLEVQGVTRLVVSAPPGVGSVSVSVTQPTGAFSLVESGFTYLPSDPTSPMLALTAASPSSGPTAGGADLTLTGTGFALGSRVFFDLVESPDVTFVSETSLVAKTVAHAPGPANLLVVTPLGGSVTLTDAYTFVAPPTISAISPSEIPATGGQLATISGTGFLPGETGSRVLLCLDFATLQDCDVIAAVDIAGSTDGTSLAFTLPPHAPGVLDLGVVNPDDQAGLLKTALTYRPLPEVLGVSPGTISTVGGQLLTVQGANFQQGATVSIGDGDCTGVLLLSAESLKCQAPAGPAGQTSITVTNPDTGAGSLAAALTRVSPPSLAAVVPNSGPELGGNQITVQGSGFVVGPPQSQVKLGDTVITTENTTVLSDTVITVTAPPGTGQVAVTVTNPDGQQATLPAAYTYIPAIPGPTFNYAIPKQGPDSGGTLVQIVGANFLDGALVYFGTAQAGWIAGTNTVVKNAGTLIQVLTPAGTIGPVDIRIVNTDGQELAKAQAFEYLGGPVKSPLALGSISPNRAVLSGKNIVTMTGQGFEPGVIVLFGDAANWVQALKTERIGPTLLKVTTPPAPNGLAEVVDVRVVNPATATGTEEVIEKLAFVYADGTNFQQSAGSRLPSEPHADTQAWIADINGDGFNDIIVTQTYGPARVLINVPPTPSQPGWFEVQSITNGIGANNRAVTDLEFGDLDGDGDLDIVWVDYYRVQRCLNDGTGAFSCVQLDSEGCDSTSVTLADLNCDALLDIFVTHNSTNCTNRLWTGRGDGSFVRRDGYLPPHHENTRDAAAVDVDLDGDIDLLLANESAMQNRLYLNNCNNTPLPPQCTVPIPGCTEVLYGGHRYQHCPQSIAYDSAEMTCSLYGYDLATLNDAAERDALKPLLTYHTWIGMRDNNGDRDFQWQYDTSSFTDWQPGQPSTDVNNQCVAMAYYWDYRWRDLRCTDGYHFLCEAPTNDPCPADWAFTDAQYGVGKSFPISGGNTRKMVVADVDLNGWPDVVVVNHDQQTNLFLNVGGQFNADNGLSWPQSEVNVHFTDLRAIDIDLDGDMDFVALKDGGDIAVYENDAANGGAGTLTDVSLTHLSDDADGLATAIAVGDLDNDLLPDVYLMAPWHSDALLMNAGYASGQTWIDANRLPAGQFARNTHRDIPEGRYNTQASDMGDIDNDGDLDIVKCGIGVPPQIIINDNGRLKNEAALRFPADLIFDCASRGIHLSDMNGDGFLDLLIAEYWTGNCADGHCSGRFWLYLNDGSGSFYDVSGGGNLPTYSSWQPTMITTLDIDADGDMDIFFGQRQSGRVFLNIGDVFHNDGVAFLEVTGQWFNAAPDVREDVQFVDIDGTPPLDFYMSANGQNKLYVSSGGKYQDVTAEYLPALSDNTYHVAIDDFDADGDLDIFTTNWGWDRFHIRESAAKFSDMTTSSLGSSGAFSLPTRFSASADLDLDGLPEVVEGNWENQNHVIRNLGGANFEVLVGALPAAWNRTRTVHIADFDGDGDLDIYFVNEGQDRLCTNNFY